MQRRKFLIGMGALTAGSAAAMGTGAFSAVQAHRSVSVEVADDADAYLSLTEESHYAQVNGDGTLSLDFTSDNATAEGGQGVNQNATSMFIHVFSIHNQGTRTVGIQIDNDDLNDALGDASNHMHFFVGEQGGGTLSAYDVEDMASELDYANPGDDDRVLEPGDTLPVGLYFLNSGEDWDVDEAVTINALDEGTANHEAP